MVRTGLPCWSYSLGFLKWSLMWYLCIQWSVRPQFGEADRTPGMEVEQSAAVDRVSRKHVFDTKKSVYEGKRLSDSKVTWWEYAHHTVHRYWYFIELRLKKIQTTLYDLFRALFLAHIIQRYNQSTLKTFFYWFSDDNLSFHVALLSL